MLFGSLLPCFGGPRPLRVVVLGEVGSGRTALLRHMAREHRQHARAEATNRPDERVVATARGPVALYDVGGGTRAEAEERRRGACAWAVVLVVDVSAGQAAMGRAAATLAAIRAIAHTGLLSFLLTAVATIALFFPRVAVSLVLGDGVA